MKTKSGRHSTLCRAGPVRSRSQAPSLIDMAVGLFVLLLYILLCTDGRETVAIR